MKPQSHGLILEPLVQGDYQFGSYSRLKGEVINESGNWLPFIPEYEHQAPVFETNSCVSHGTLNAVEILFNYIFGETPNFSDRFVATGSGTDPARGNTPKKVADFFRKNWAPQDTLWSMAGAKTVQDYYAPLPENLFKEAATLKSDNVFGYEYVQPNPTTLREALKRGPVGMSVALMPDEKGEYYRPQGWADSHWVTLLQIRPDGKYVILDSYDPFIKIIRADFVSTFAYRYELNEELANSLMKLIRALRTLFRI